MPEIVEVHSDGENSLLAHVRSTLSRSPNEHVVTLDRGEGKVSLNVTIRNSRGPTERSCGRIAVYRGSIQGIEERSSSS